MGPAYIGDGELGSKGKEMGKHFVFWAEKEPFGQRCQFGGGEAGRVGWGWLAGYLLAPFRARLGVPSWVLNMRRQCMWGHVMSSVLQKVFQVCRLFQSFSLLSLPFSTENETALLLGWDSNPDTPLVGT